jgi:hypothetical protein
MENRNLRIYRLVETKSSSTPPVVEPPSRYTQHLNIKELFRSTPLMTTEADVDALTSDLGNKLKSYIRTNKNVRLV